jgi:hypothetical protein
VSSRFAGLTLALAIIAVALTGPLYAQGVTAQLGGTITDSTGGVLPGVTVVVKNVNTLATRETLTGARGEFMIPDLLAGTFDLTASLAGFKPYVQKGIVINSTDRVQLRAIALEVGGLTETVSVQAEAVQVQTTSGARQSLVTRENFEDIALKGRDFAGMLKVLPGVIDTSVRDAPGWESMNGLTINGQANFNYTYDGVTNKDTGQNRANYSAPALDSIAQVRVQSSNFNAEFGRSSGATINVITRSGTQNFRGSAAYYNRDDSMNGNEYTRRVSCAAGTASACDAAYYKYNNFAWTLGGPIGKQGGNNKLFFFFSQDILHRKDPGTLNQRRTPTALERQGNFSQTLDSQGRLIYIRDPLKTGNCSTTSGGPACFTGNIIPADRIDKNGLALLNMLPMPNATDPSGRNEYNYAFQTETNQPRNDQVLRVDWNIAQNTQAYGRLQFGKETREGGVAILGSTGGWPQMATSYTINTVGWVGTVLHTFSPTLFGEFTVGVNWSHQNTAPMNQAEQDKNDRTKVLPGMPQYFPDANPMHLVPNANFAGGVPGTVLSLGVENRFPFYGYNTLFNFSTNITKASGTHTFKSGFFLEYTTRPAQRTSNFNGDFGFGTDHPNNTNIGMANALLGSVSSYTESDGHPQAHGQFAIAEWYVQDTWRVAKRVTLDAGVRFYYMQPTQSAGDQVAQFEPTLWTAGKAPVLFSPVRNSAGQRVAQDPRTGQQYPAVYIGRIVPGSGDVYNGMQTYDGTPHQTNPFRVAPRVSFAWDVRGDGKTAVRGGAGVFYDRYQDDEVLQLVSMPPLLNTWRTNYTTINELLKAPLTATPTGLTRIDPFTPPMVYNWSIGMQQDVGLGLVADAAYVGNAQRNQIMSYAINGRPYGYAYQPSSLDSTNVLGGQAQPLPNDFLRPDQGWGSITNRQFTGYTDYHALQLSINRSRSRSLRAGASYTYQLSNQSLGTIDPYIQDNRARNYTQGGRRPHVLTINYSYDVPKLSNAWNNIIAKVVFDDWQISGITTWSSGTYGGLGYSFVNAPTGALTGTGGIDAGGSRVVLTCDPNLPGGDQTFTRQFATECVAPPTDQFRLGTATNDELLGKSWSNWDISLFKNIPMGGSRRLQLRFEFYNAFNTDQFLNRNTTAQFDYTTKALVNTTTFGATATTGNNVTNPARRIQLGVRFTF